MSEKDIIAFLEAVKKVETLQKKLKMLMIKHKIQVRENVTELVKIANTAGFVFTVSDFIRSKAEFKKLSIDDFDRFAEFAVYCEEESLTTPGNNFAYNVYAEIPALL